MRPLTEHSASADWRSWKGSLSETTALADHIREHRLEVELRAIRRFAKWKLESP